MLLEHRGWLMEIDWTRHIVIGLLSALVVFAITTWGSKSPTDRRGWRSLKPGAMYAVAICGGALLTLFMAYIWLFVGSSRPDGKSQMTILFWLIMAFGCGTMITIFQYGQARRSMMRWRGNALYWRGKDGTEYTRDLGDAVGLRQDLLGPVFIVFGDGAEARIDPYSDNALLLIRNVADRLNPDKDSPEDRDG
jgi:hypothetical protein